MRKENPSCCGVFKDWCGKVETVLRCQRSDGVNSSLSNTNCEYSRFVFQLSYRSFPLTLVPTPATFLLSVYWVILVTSSLTRADDDSGLKMCLHMSANKALLKDLKRLRIQRK